MSILLGFTAALVPLGILIIKLHADKARLSTTLEHERRAHEEMGNAFSLTAQEVLKKSSEQFLQLAQEKLKQANSDGKYDLEKRQTAIGEMVKPIHKQLEALSGALEQVKGTDKALRDDLQSLSKETAKLVGALRDPSAQGHWGEFILEGLLEKSGLIKGVHYETQVSMESEDGSRQRPDAVISLQDGFHIIVDAKAPINEFASRLAENISEEETNKIMQNLAKQVREHVRKLGKKTYWENIESPDFVVMFLPSEHIYSVALRSDPKIVDYAAEQGVIIASPTLMMSLLRVVGMSWRQVELAKNAQEISARGMELYKRLLAFTGHIEKIGKGITGAMKGYNDAIGSLERSVLPSARKLKELQGHANADDMPQLTQVETVKRELTVDVDGEEEKLKERA